MNTQSIPRYQPWMITRPNAGQLMTGWRRYRGQSNKIAFAIRSNACKNMDALPFLVGLSKPLQTGSPLLRLCCRLTRARVGEVKAGTMVEKESSSSGISEEEAAQYEWQILWGTGRPEAALNFPGVDYRHERTWAEIAKNLSWREWKDRSCWITNRYLQKTTELSSWFEQGLWAKIGLRPLWNEPRISTPWCVWRWILRMQGRN